MTQTHDVIWFIQLYKLNVFHYFKNAIVGMTAQLRDRVDARCIWGPGFIPGSKNKNNKKVIVKW